MKRYQIELDEIITRISTISRTAIDPVTKKTYIEEDPTSANLAINSISNLEGASIKWANRERVLVELGKNLGAFTNKVEQGLKIDLSDRLKKARLRVKRAQKENINVQDNLNYKKEE